MTKPLVMLSVLLIAFVLATNTGVSKAVESKGGQAQKCANGKLYRLRRLKYRTNNHQEPDALVYITDGFNPAKKVNLIIFNHGLMTGADETWRIWQMEKYMHLAPPNTVFVLPEWAFNPKAYSVNSGPFNNYGFFKNMLVEIFSSVAELNSVDVDSLSDIAIMTYSGGWKPSMAQLYNNGMNDQIKSVTLFDSLYRPNAIDQWLKQNINELATGKKQYQNFYFDTAVNSNGQYQRLQNLLSQNGLSEPSLLRDDDHPGQVMDESKIAAYSIVLKRTNIQSPQYIAHRHVVTTYFPQVLKAMTLRAQARN